jgi:hypothetical protein
MILDTKMINLWKEITTLEDCNTFNILEKVEQYYLNTIICNIKHHMVTSIMDFSVTGCHQTSSSTSSVSLGAAYLQ